MFEREVNLYAAAQASFSEGQKVAIERKLNAFDKLWDVVLKFRNNLPAILTFIDVLSVDEYRKIRDHPTFQTLAHDLSLERITGMAIQLFGSIENVRPYVTEYLWAIFFSYRAIMIRILVLLYLGLNESSKLEWHKDTVIRALIEAVLSPEELIEFDMTQFGKVSWLQRTLESKILYFSRKVISGEEFGADSLKQAKKIQELAARSLSETVE